VVACRLIKEENPNLDLMKNSPYELAVDRLRLLRKLAVLEPI